MNRRTQDKCSIFSRRASLNQYVTLVLLTYFMGLLTLAAAEPDISIAKVSVKTFSELLITDERSVAATVISLNQPILRAQITANVRRIHAEIGDQVKQGNVLLSLDCREYHYTLQQAKARYQARKLQIKLLKKNYQRDQGLLQQSTISPTRFDQSETDYLSAQVDIKTLEAQQSLAQLQVERCQIKAPFSGEIVQRQVQKGQLVTHQTALFTLLQVNDLHISAQLTATEIVDIQQTKQIIFRQHHKDHFLKLDHIVSLANEKTRTQKLRFSLMDQYTTLITGSAGRVMWQSPDQKLPAAYVSKRKNQLGVFILKEKKTAPKAVFIPLPQAQEGRAVKVDFPLNYLIIDAGRLQLRDQQGVKIQ